MPLLQKCKRWLTIIRICSTRFRECLIVPSPCKKQLRLYACQPSTAVVCTWLKILWESKEKATMVDIFFSFLVFLVLLWTSSNIAYKSAQKTILIRVSPTSSLCVMKGRSPRLLLRDLTTSVWLAPYLRGGRSSSRNCVETRYRFISVNCRVIVPWWWWQCGPWQVAPHWTKSSGLSWTILSFKTKATNNLLQQEIFSKVDSVSNRVQEEATKRFVGVFETSENRDMQWWWPKYLMCSWVSGGWAHGCRRREDAAPGCWGRTLLEMVRRLRSSSIYTTISCSYPTGGDSRPPAGCVVWPCHKLQREEQRPTVQYSGIRTSIH